MAFLFSPFYYILNYAVPGVFAVRANIDSEERLRAMSPGSFLDDYDECKKLPLG